MCYNVSNVRAVYEIIWKNMVQLDKLRMTTYDAFALHAGCLRLQTHTEIYNNHCLFTASMVK
jgi:hypothetical protein